MYVHKIPVHGHIYTFNRKDTWLQEAIEKVLECTVVECDIELNMQNCNSQVRATGHVKVVIQQACDLCADDVTVSFEDKINLLYLSSSTPDPDFVPKNKKELDKINNMISLQEEELDVGWYYDGMIDLAVVITEHLLIVKQGIVQCKDTNVRRLQEGECREFPTEGSKNTYNPFAGLEI